MTRASTTFKEEGLLLLGYQAWVGRWVGTGGGSRGRPGAGGEAGSPREGDTAAPRSCGTLRTGRKSILRKFGWVSCGVIYPWSSSEENCTVSKLLGPDVGSFWTYLV